MQAVPPTTMDDEEDVSPKKLEATFDEAAVAETPKESIGGSHLNDGDDDGETKPVGENEEAQDTLPSPSQAETPQRDGSGEGVTEDDLEALEVAVALAKTPPPPSLMGEKKMQERLRRIFKARADGSYLVPEDLLKDYQNKFTRPKIEALFEKVGYSPDWVLEKQMFDCFKFWSENANSPVGFSMWNLDLFCRFWLTPFYLKKWILNYNLITSRVPEELPPERRSL